MVLDCTRAGNVSKACEGGVPETALKFMRTTYGGVYPESEYPYTSADGISSPEDCPLPWGATVGGSGWAPYGTGVWQSEARMPAAACTTC